jgi:2-isopropylmalate synthase
MKLVHKGKPQALKETFLGKAETAPDFLKRFVLLNKKINPNAPCHIAAHLVKNLKNKPEPYVHPHAHPSCHEIGLVIGQPGALEYEIMLDNKVHQLCSPASVFIPAGTVHRARALRGSGAYVCILMDSKGPSSANSKRKKLKTS